MSKRALTRAEINKQLPEIADEIDDLTTRLNDAYARRLRLWSAGAGQSPRVRHHELATMSRVRTSTVSVALAKEAKLV